MTEPLRAFRQGDRATRAARAAALLEQVALPRAFLTRRPGALSGGQRQRVAGQRRGRHRLRWRWTERPPGSLALRASPGPGGQDAMA